MLPNVSDKYKTELLSAFIVFSLLLQTNQSDFYLSLYIFQHYFWNSDTESSEWTTLQTLVYVKLIFPKIFCVHINTTRWLYCVECPQYIIRLKALGYLCDCLSGSGLITSSGHAHLDRQRYVACEVTENLGVGLLHGVYRPGNGFELIPMVKI